MHDRLTRRTDAARPFLTTARRGLAVLLLACVACGESTPAGPSAAAFEFDFAQSDFGWVAGFADYPPGDEAFYELESGHRLLPAPLDGSRLGLFISGNNHSDDLFMFWKKRVVGLRPGETYGARLTVEFATNAPRDCAGVGGAPGEGVTVKAGASAVEPAAVARGDIYEMSIDKGNQVQGGANAAAIGNVAGSRTCDTPDIPFELKRLATPAAIVVTADSGGGAWLIVGTDSGFEATTSLYYTFVSVSFEPQ